VGKYGVTPDEDATDAGPFDRWPTGKGFDHFFGFLGSQTDQYKPDLVEDQAHVIPDGRHLNEQITDKAISYIDRQKKAAPDKPFFLYYTPGATHAPHQVAQHWSNLYKGKFDEGWDAYREKVFARQKQLGIIPADAILPARNPDIKAWTSSRRREKAVCALHGSVCGYLTYTDHEIGRVVEHLKEIDQYDNTLIFVMIGDNAPARKARSMATSTADSLRSRCPSRRTSSTTWQDRRNWHAERQRRQLSVGLGSGCQHAIQVLEIGCQQRRRHAQSLDHLLSEGDQGCRRHPYPVWPRDRHSADHARTAGP